MTRTRTIVERDQFTVTVAVLLVTIELVHVELQTRMKKRCVPLREYGPTVSVLCVAFAIAVDVPSLFTAYH